MNIDLKKIAQRYGRVDFGTGSHAIEIRANREQIFQAIRDLRTAEVRLMKPLFALRGLPALLTGQKQFSHEGVSILQGMHKEGFRIIQDQSDKLIFGVMGKFWKLTGLESHIPEKVEEYHAAPPRGMAKAIGYFGCEPGGSENSHKLVHATWVYTPDPKVKRTFGTYWRIIYPGAYILRKSWLAAIKRKAEKEASLYPTPN